MREGTGEPFYHVGSHRIGEYRYHNRFKGVAEAQRLGFSEAQTAAKIGQHVERIARQAQGLGLRTERFLARRGDVVTVTVNHRLNVFGYLHLGDLLPQKARPARAS